jgi:hypothetical protein
VWWQWEEHKRLCFGGRSDWGWQCSTPFIRWTRCSSQFFYTLHLTMSSSPAKDVVAVRGNSRRRTREKGSPTFRGRFRGVVGRTKWGRVFERKSACCSHICISTIITTSCGLLYATQPLCFVQLFNLSSHVQGVPPVCHPARSLPNTTLKCTKFHSRRATDAACQNANALIRSM